MGGLNSLGRSKYDIGSVVGRLTVLDKKRENNRSYFYCRCECGNEKWIRSDTLATVKSWGCLGKENLFEAKDITGMKFGRLTALEKTDERDNSNGSIVWKCKCECGNITYVPEYLLKKGGVRSCGCLGKENSRQNIQKAIKKHLEEHIVFNTNLPAITREEPTVRNTSGIVGVHYDRERNKWVAQIRFRKKQYSLGRYDKKEDAIKVRQIAKENLHGNFLQWYNEYKKNKEK